MRWPLELALGLAALGGSVLLSLPSRAPGPSRIEAEQSEQPSAPLRDAPESLTTSYTLSARLDPVAHRVDASGVIEWSNTSKAAVRSLFVHLYLNAFKNDRTLYLRSPHALGRSGRRPTHYGALDVQRLVARELGGVDVWPGRVRHSPGDPDDETDIEVPLPRPIEPGERLTFEVAFTAQLPSVVERTGFHESFHFVGQWFPKIARLEPDGRFAHFAFHPLGEFYSDFGKYDVTIDVPEGYVVGATGVAEPPRVQAGRRVQRFLAEPVHDFAWTAWDGFVERRRPIAGVDVRHLAPMGHGANAEATFATLATALPYFNQKYGRYPYPNLTVVHPPEGAEPAGGMEYPTLITTGGGWYFPYLGVRGVETVAAHELAHQWFYGLLASNEAKEPFLDEGLTSYAEVSMLTRWLGRASAARAFGLSISTLDAFRSFAAEAGPDEVIAKPASEFSGMTNVGALVYARTAVLLETMARVYGRARVERALRDYAESFRFRHPTAEGLLSKVHQHVGDAARRYLEVGLLERGRLNLVVREIINVPERAPEGYFERASGRERVVAPPEGATGFRGSVTVYRHGTFELPVDVLLIAQDGTRELQHWDGRGSHRIFEHHGAAPLVRVIVDPEHKILVDEDPFDNQIATLMNGAPRVSERLSYAAALVLGGVLP